MKLMKSAAGDRVEVSETGCVGPCSLGVNVVAGWSSGKKFTRAGVERAADDPAGQVSKSAMRKTKPGVYSKVATREDCEEVVRLLTVKAKEALGETDTIDN